MSSSALGFSPQENISLQSYNTLSVPVSTHWFCCVDNDQELLHAIAWARETACDILVLGGGSNIVLANDFSGLAIKLDTRGINIEQETETDVYLSVAAGENWHNTVMHCVSKQWYGIENLALIPGSVGAAPIQNIGAYGVELTQCFSYLDAVNIATGKTQRFDHASCEFAYRDSVFKGTLKDQYIITRVVLRLSKQPVWNISYPALAERLSSEALTIQNVADTVCAIRRSKLPDPKDIPNAGSFFKNPIVTSEQFQSIQQSTPNLVAYPHGDQHYKLAAGWLIDQAGWKGKVVDGIAMHGDQALVLTNPSRLSGHQLLDFVALLQADILHKYGVQLEVEPRIFM